MPAAPVQVSARDGVPVRGFVRAAPDAAPDRPVVIVNCATSVRCRYYDRFADDLFAHGADVVTWDYRGIGESKPASWRGFDASWTDWGALDFEAVLSHVLATFPDRPVDVVGHSFGGCAIGLAPSAHRIRRVVTVGAQYAYWRDYAPDHRWRMAVKWHLAMPLLATVLGHVPAKRLGWMEDTPRGVALDWAVSWPLLEQRRSLRATGVPPTFAAVDADVLAIGLEDDPFGTVPALDRLLGYFTGSRRTHWRIAPADIGVDAIGHFAFFHSRFQQSLWPVARAWLATGSLPAGTPGSPS